MEPPARIVAGIVMLAFGRALFWLFLGLLGFAVGVDIAAGTLPDVAPPIRVALATGVGLLGTLLAIALRRVALGVARELSLEKPIRRSGRLSRTHAPPLLMPS